MESDMLNSLTLNQAQPVEVFHGIVLEKGRKLGKLGGDLMNKFVDMCLKQLAFYVRAGKWTTRCMHKLTVVFHFNNFPENYIRVKKGDI